MTNRNRFAAAIATACTGLALASNAGAVDLRSWDQRINVTSNRFIVLASFKNEAVLDKETQLVWQRTPDSIRTAWQTADHDCIKASTGGRRGWRLPSRSEFMSLVDPAAASPIMLPAGHPFNIVTAAGTGYYWTSDPYNTSYVLSAGQSKAMANIYLATGGVYYSYMSNSSAIAWCVRAPGQ
jgi:hypothetical protein